jgi:hypothetical protein
MPRHHKANLVPVTPACPSNYPFHFGTDFANRKSGDPIYMGISGRVIGSYGNTNNNGYWSAVEYGFLFEGSFVGSGIYGEYMHMQNQSTHTAGTYLTGNQIIGNVGDTGASFNSKGERVPHFHHTIYTLQYTSPEYNGFSDTTLRMLFNNNIGKTVNSKEAKPYIGTNGNSATKVTYGIENYLNRLKK